MRWLVLLFALPAAALAQNTLIMKQPQAISATATAHTCDAWYPAAEQQKGVDGVTVLSVKLGTDFAVSEPVLVRSSGMPDLDAATLECSKHIMLRPATLDGQPIAVTWQLEFDWRSATPSNFHVPWLSQDAAACAYPDASQRQGHEGYTMIKFRIAPDGSVKNPQIEQASGFDDLDSAAIACALTRRYPPASLSGRPVEVDWHSRFAWQLRS